MHVDEEEFFLAGRAEPIVVEMFNKAGPLKCRIAKPTVECIVAILNVSPTQSAFAHYSTSLNVIGPPWDLSTHSVHPQ